MRKRLVLGEVGQEIVYIKEPKNIVDAIEAIRPFFPKEEGMRPLHLDRSQAIQVKNRSLRERLKDNLEY